MTRLHRFRGSLLARLLVGYLLVATVFSAAWLWSLYGPLTDAALHQQQRNLTAVAQSSALVAAGSDVDVERLARQLVARTDLRLTIVDARGTVIADSNSNVARMEDHSDRPEVADALRGVTGVARRVSRTEGIEELYVAVPASLAGERVALRVSQPLYEIEEIAASSRRFGLILLAFAAVLAVAVSITAARGAAAPVRELTEAAERMARGDLDVAVPEMPSDLAALARSLSDLRSQVRARLEALDTERGTLRATLDGLEDAVLVIESGTIRLASRGCDVLFGSPAGGWEGVALTDAALPSTIGDAVTRGLKSPEPASEELAPDPTGRAFRVHTSPLDSPHADSRFIVAVSDITERARLDRVRRDFVANASHELKTPTAGIRLLAQSAESAAQDGDAEQSLAFTRQIESETQRLQHLVADLLDLSRLEAVPSRSSMTDVREALDRAVLSHRAAATRKGLSVDVDADAVRGGGVFASADPTDVAIALDNLLDNAIAYTESGGVRIRVGLTDSELRFEVSDTGPGIPAEHLPRIFERFYRVDTGRSRDVGGTGLGLSLVRHVAERNGGGVTVTSSLGEGSAFSLTLPRAI